MTRKEHFTLRLSPQTIDRLVLRAERMHRPKTVLAEQILEEGLRMADHPGIIFRDGPAGRRPGIAGHGLDVWEIVETVQIADGDAQVAASYLDISPGLVDSALDYYADYRNEIDEWIEANRRMAEDAEAAWKRRQASLTA